MYFREHTRPLFLDNKLYLLFLLDNVFPIWQDAGLWVAKLSGFFAVKKRSLPRVGWVDRQLNNCGLQELTRDLFGFRRDKSQKSSSGLLPALSATQRAQAPARLSQAPWGQTALLDIMNHTAIRNRSYYPCLVIIVQISGTWYVHQKNYSIYASRCIVPWCSSGRLHVSLSEWWGISHLKQRDCWGGPFRICCCWTDLI